LGVHALYFGVRAFFKPPPNQRPPSVQPLGGRAPSRALAVGLGPPVAGHWMLGCQPLAAGGLEEYQGI